MSSTTIALNVETKNKLQDIVHKLEKRDRCDHSYGDAIDHLLSIEEMYGTATD